MSGKRSLSLLLQRLREYDITVISMRNKSNRLEELFLELTGQEDALMKIALAWVAFSTIIIRESDALSGFGGNLFYPR